MVCVECKTPLAWLEMVEDSSSLALSSYSLDFHNFSLINPPLKFPPPLKFMSQKIPPNLVRLSQTSLVRLLTLWGYPCFYRSRGGTKKEIEEPG